MRCMWPTRRIAVDWGAGARRARTLGRLMGTLIPEERLILEVAKVLMGAAAVM